jgi:hypothetical protein
MRRSEPRSRLRMSGTNQVPAVHLGLFDVFHADNRLVP